MAKNNRAKKSVKQSSKRIVLKSTDAKKSTKKINKGRDFKTGLLEVDKQEDTYNKLFEQKLARQYREFRNLKEHRIQFKKFLRVFGILVVIILVALLLLSFS